MKSLVLFLIIQCILFPSWSVDRVYKAYNSSGSVILTISDYSWSTRLVVSYGTVISTWADSFRSSSSSFYMSNYVSSYPRNKSVTVDGHLGTVNGTPAFSGNIRGHTYNKTNGYRSDFNYDYVALLEPDEWDGVFFYRYGWTGYTHGAVGLFADIPASEAGNAYSESLCISFTVVDGTISSPQLGTLEAGASAQWTRSSYFGFIHYGRDASQYGGWVWSERFGWMKFVKSGASNFLWAPMMSSWMAVNQDGSFHSFQWGQLTPEGLNRYQSSIFGGLTTGDFGGWVSSDRFGWMWANGDGTWFWSETRQEWLGVTADGGIWSTGEGRFL